MSTGKIVLNSSLASFVLVISLAFTSQPARQIDFLYVPGSGQTYIPATISGSSIIATELNEDKNRDSLPDSWAAGIFAVRHSQGNYLLGIEFDAEQVTLQAAADILYDYYVGSSALGTLPADGETIAGVTVFRRR